ncbi:hypothetical protein Zmor_010361 [Zophobas morio]|uniref:Uncharacterized protein n=1 Tax=Zophobas morio TaxID=2755281 RepID=A0AA38ISL5_9CUCU|nr:hypothetical protein Zmor_010361 [Zophobas morio]
MAYVSVAPWPTSAAEEIIFTPWTLAVARALASSPKKKHLRCSSRRNGQMVLCTLVYFFSLVVSPSLQIPKTDSRSCIVGPARLS